jgi:hypothetical protein
MDSSKQSGKLGGLGLESSNFHDSQPIDYEQILFEALVNEGKHIRVRNIIDVTSFLF